MCRKTGDQLFNELSTNTLTNSNTSKNPRLTKCATVNVLAPTHRTSKSVSEYQSVLKGIIKTAIAKPENRPRLAQKDQPVINRAQNSKSRSRVRYKSPSQHNHIKVSRHHKSPSYTPSNLVYSKSPIIELVSLIKSLKYIYLSLETISEAIKYAY